MLILFQRTFRCYYYMKKRQSRVDIAGRNQVLLAKGLKNFIIGVYFSNVRKQQAIIDAYELEYKKLDRIREKTEDNERINS